MCNIIGIIKCAPIKISACDFMMSFCEKDKSSYQNFLVSYLAPPPRTSALQRGTPVSTSTLTNAMRYLGNAAK